MADFGSPVAQNVSVSPLQSLSSLLSLKQQQLGLQQQALAIQGAQQDVQTKTAQATQATISASQQKALSQVNWSQFQNEDGSMDLNRASDVALSVAPNEGPGFIQRLGAMSEQSVKTRQAALGLNQEYQDKLRSIFGTWSAGDGNTSDLAVQLEQFRDSLPENSKGAVQQIMDHTLQVMGMPDLLSGKPKTPQDQKAAALAFSRAGLSPEGVSGAGGIATPITGTQYDKNGKLVGTAQSRTTGAVSTPPNQGVEVGLGPTQQIPYQASLAAATSGAGARATGTAGIDVQRANMVSSNIQPSVTAIDLTHQIDALSDQIHSGKFAEAISQAAAAAGEKADTYARQILVKDLGQLKTTATKNSPSDESRMTILSGYPDSSSDPQTIHTAMDLIRGSFKQNLARGQLLNSYQKTHPDLSGFQQADDAFTSKYGPLETEFQSLKTPQERIGFYQRNFRSKEEAAAFKQRLTAANGP